MCILKLLSLRFYNQSRAHPHRLGGGGEVNKWVNVHNVTRRERVHSQRKVSVRRESVISTSYKVRKFSRRRRDLRAEKMKRTSEAELTKTFWVNVDCTIPCGLFHWRKLSRFVQTSDFSVSFAFYVVLLQIWCVFLRTIVVTDILAKRFQESSTSPFNTVYSLSVLFFNLTSVQSHVTCFVSFSLNCTFVWTSFNRPTAVRLVPEHCVERASAHDSSELVADVSVHKYCQFVSVRIWHRYYIQCLPYLWVLSFLCFNILIRNFLSQWHDEQVTGWSDYVVLPT